MIKMSTSIPDVINTDEQSLRDILTAMKLYCEELARKAQSSQEEIRNGVPAVTDVEEGEFVRYINGATIRIYTKQDGVIRYFALT